MPDVLATATRLALEINKDNLWTFGAFAEIGAGQEVARHFFQAGSASYTVAKAMSAYAMQVSDDIYVSRLKKALKVPTGKPFNDIPYTGRYRLMAMLDYEYGLMIERFANPSFKEYVEGLRRERAKRYPDSQLDRSESLPALFAYANTVTTGTYGTAGDRCNGWMGVRVQCRLRKDWDLELKDFEKDEYVDLLVHVVCLEQNREAQFDTLGALGVFVLNTALGIANGQRKGVVELGRIVEQILGPPGESLDKNTVRIDVLEVNPSRECARMFRDVSNQRFALELVRHELSHAVLLSRDRSPARAGIRDAKTVKTITAGYPFTRPKTAWRTHRQSESTVEWIFPHKFVRVPVRFLGRQDMLVHLVRENELKKPEALDVAAWRTRLSRRQWGATDPKRGVVHVVVVPYRYLSLVDEPIEKDRVQDFKPSPTHAIVKRLLDLTGRENANSMDRSGETVAIFVTRFSDLGYLAQYLVSYSYKSSVYITLTREDLEDIVEGKRQPARSPEEDDEDRTNPEHSQYFRRGHLLNWASTWSPSVEIALMRVASAGCELRIADKSAIDLIRKHGLLRHLHATGKLKIVSRRMAQPRDRRTHRKRDATRKRRGGQRA